MPEKKPNTIVTKELRHKVRVLYLTENRSLNDIGRQLGIAQTTARNILNEAGVPIRARAEAMANAIREKWAGKGPYQKSVLN